MSVIIGAYGLDILKEFLTDDHILVELVKKGNKEGLKKAINTPGLDFQNDDLLLRNIQSVSMIDFLLEEIVDLNKMCNNSHVSHIVRFILKKTLKVKVNPNGLTKNGSVIWHVWMANTLESEHIFLKYATSEASKNNFTEALDINARNNLGNTYLHQYVCIDEILKYKPDASIKNNDGQDALTYMKATRQVPKSLEDYVAIPEENPKDLAAMALLLDESNKKLAASEARFEAIKSVLVGTP